MQLSHGHITHCILVVQDLSVIIITNNDTVRWHEPDREGGCIQIPWRLAKIIRWWFQAQSPPGLAGMQLDVAGMEVSYTDSECYFKLQLGPSCFTMPKSGRPHVPQRDVLMAYTHGFCARFSTFHGNSTWQMKNFTARYLPQCISYENGALLSPVIVTGVRISR